MRGGDTLSLSPPTLGAGDRLAGSRGEERSVNIVSGRHVIVTILCYTTRGPLSIVTTPTGMHQPFIPPLLNYAHQHFHFLASNVSYSQLLNLLYKRLKYNHI